MIEWYDIRKVEDKLSAVNIIIGGRGIGKTYSALSFVLEKQKPFIYLRNTDVQLKECITGFGNPFKRLNMDTGSDIFFKSEKSHSLIYDEFIEKRSLSFRQFECFISFYETVNRNRELLGEAPLCCILLSNSQRLSNPILAGYGIIPTIENMIRTGQKEYRKPGMYLSLPSSAVSDLKKNTANYTLINGTKIADEALNNAFAFDSFYGIKRRNLNEYIPVVQIDDIYIYKHKTTGRLYACMSQAQNIPVFTSRDNKTAFLRAFGRKLFDAASKGFIDYSDFVTKTLLLDIIK